MDFSLSGVDKPLIRSGPLDSTPPLRTHSVSLDEFASRCVVAAGVPSPSQDGFVAPRSMLHTRAADSPFAWVSNVISVSMRHFSPDSCPATTLARHADVVLRWHPHFSASVEELLTAVSMRFPRVVALQVNQQRLEARACQSNNLCCAAGAPRHAANPHTCVAGSVHHGRG